MGVKPGFAKMQICKFAKTTERNAPPRFTPNASNLGQNSKISPILFALLNWELRCSAAYSLSLFAVAHVFPPYF